MYKYICLYICWYKFAYSVLKALVPSLTTNIALSVAVTCVGMKPENIRLEVNVTVAMTAMIWVEIFTYRRYEDVMGIPTFRHPTLLKLSVSNEKYCHFVICFFLR